MKDIKFSNIKDNPLYAPILKEVSYAMSDSEYPKGTINAIAISTTVRILDVIENQKRKEENEKAN